MSENEIPKGRATADYIVAEVVKQLLPHLANMFAETLQVQPIKRKDSQSHKLKTILDVLEVGKSVSLPLDEYSSAVVSNILYRVHKNDDSKHFRTMTVGNSIIVARNI